MKKIYRKGFSFFILLLTALPLLQILILQVKQQQLRDKMKIKLQTGLLHTVTLDKNEVHWIRPGKEILINGKMFDIKSFSVGYQTITFSGLYDEDETILTDQVRKEQQHRLSGNNQLAQLIHFFQSLYNDNSLIETLLIAIPGKDPAGCYNSSLLTPFISVFSPPPRPDYSLSFFI